MLQTRCELTGSPDITNSSVNADSVVTFN